jgi:hypothetical protein
MSVKLMTSAMMPNDGVYLRVTISEKEFLRQLIHAYNRGELESYVGYQQNADYIFRKTGIRIPVNRGETNLKSGDVMLVMKLKYRVADPGLKGEVVDEHQFEFCRVRYWTSKDFEALYNS